jgi:hypothetical protein
MAFLWLQAFARIIAQRTIVVGVRQITSHLLEVWIALNATSSIATLAMRTGTADGPISKNNIVATPRAWLAMMTRCQSLARARRAGYLQARQASALTQT